MILFRNAFADLSAALARRRVWFALASEDISDQHRRTSLGPVWLLLNYLIFAGAFIFIMGSPGGVPNYAAYVAIGLFVWFYIMETINSGVGTFVREEPFIKGTTLPLSIYILRTAAQSVIRAGYAAVGCAIIVGLSGAEPNWTWLMAFFGLALIVLVTPAAITIFAFLGAYFPDARFIVQNLTRVGMFLTPVFWAYTGPPDLGVRAFFYYFNPFTYFLEIVRVPILSGDIPVRSFILCVTVSVVAWVIALLLLGSLRKRIAFVL